MERSVKSRASSVDKVAKMLSTLKTTWPIILAVAFNRCGAIYGSYGSYASTDSGLATDGATLVCIAILLVPFIAIGIGKLSFDEVRTRRMLRISIVLQALCLVCLGLTHYFPVSDTLHFVLHVVNGIIEVIVSGCWLCKLRGVPTSVVVFTLFTALAVSEVLFWPGYFLDDFGDAVVAVIITLAQFPLIGASAARQGHLQGIARVYEIDRPWDERGEVNNARFLVTSGVCLGLLSMVDGFLRGFPAGEPIALDFPSRMLYFLLVLAMCLGFCFYVMRKERRSTIAAMWVTAQVLACAAMILYAAFPDALGIGGALTTVLNAACVVYIWVLVVEFMSYGNKDPFYYAIGGRIVFMGGRAISRATEGLLVAVLGMTPLLMFALASAALVLSTTVLVYVYIFQDQKSGLVVKEEARSGAQHTLRTIMGVDIDDKSSLSDMREATMRRQVEQIGRQFLLSGREVEVLTLYAMGFKQQSVAEQLGISPGTVHAHIKRIYSKTDMHSRQDVLDYIDKYCT